MCLQSAAFSRLDNIDSMETIQSENCRENKHLLKDCRVVLVPLRDDIARRKTVSVHSIEDFNSASNLHPVFYEGVERKDCRETKSWLPISIYPKINNGIITEVQCETFRKRKCEVRLEMDVDDEIVVDVMKCLLDKVTSEPVKSHSIDFTSPGVKEIQLVRDFCRENDYESRDYQDLKGLFTFRTLPVVEVTKSFKSGGKRQSIQKKKTVVNRTESICVRKKNEEVPKNIPSNGLSGSGLEKIENLKIRKILEDFERLSKSEENIAAPKQKKIKTDSSSSIKKNAPLNKPLNLCKKDNREIEKPIKISKSVQSDISISGSILRTLLHNEECVENSTADHPKESRDKIAPRQTKTPLEGHQKKTSKKSTAQQTQTDLDSITDEKLVEKNQIEANGKSDKWLNDPTAILKKIQKLKKDILYLDLLAEEKEKERIAILCFKNYKESILKKIFASEMSEEVSEARNSSTSSPSVVIPKLIHPSGNVNALIEQRPLNSALYPSSASLVERQNSCSTLPDNPSIHINPINENFIRLGNCIKCDLLKTNFLNSKYRNPWYCNPLCQAHSCTQHAKECKGFVEASSSK